MNWQTLQGAMQSLEMDNQLNAARSNRLNPQHGKVVLPDSAILGKDSFMRRLCIVFAWHPDKDARDRAYRTLVKTYPGNFGQNENLDPMPAMLIDEFCQTPYPPTGFIEAHEIIKIQHRPESEMKSEYKPSKPSAPSYKERLELQQANPGNPLFNIEINDLVNHYMQAKTDQDKKATYELIKTKYPGYAGEKKDLSDDMALVLNEYQQAAEKEEMEFGSVFTEASFESVPIPD